MPVDRPARLKLLHPKFKRPIADAEGKPAYIDLLSTDSTKAVEYERRRATDRISKGVRERLSYDEIDQADAERLAAVTVGWHLVVPARDAAGNLEDRPGAAVDIPCTLASATELYLRRDLAWIRDQVAVFLAERANFV